MTGSLSHRMTDVGLRGVWALALVATALLVVGAVHAQDDMDHYGPKPTRAPRAKSLYEANQASHKGNPDKLVLPGLLADRKARTVELLVESTGLNGGAIAEFLLVDQASSHGYEALLWSFAKPSDVHHALEFIGVKAATPPHPGLPRLWSDGGRVRLDLRELDGVDGVPIERLIVDNETEETLPEEGFVFAGSIRLPPRDGKGKTIYVADAYDPRSVASVYNEPAAVLDVPRQVSKGEAYGRLLVNEDYAMEGGKLLTLVMTPQDPAGTPPPKDLVLSIDRAATNGVMCRLSDREDNVIHKASAVKPLVELLVTMAKEETAPYLTLRFGGSVPVETLSRICSAMAMLESMGLVMVKPPASGTLYYRAFIPNRSWLKPEGRPSQPWELSRSTPRRSRHWIWHPGARTTGSDRWRCVAPACFVSDATRRRWSRSAKA